MKILKHKNIMQIIYGVLLLMPFLAILGRTAYVVVNKNAYQSYSEVSSTNLQLVSNENQSIENMNYMITLKTTGSAYSDTIYINSSTIDYDYISGTDLSYEVKAIRFYPNNTHLRFLDADDNAYNYALNDEKREYLNGQTFNYKSGNLYSSSYTNQAVNFYMITYGKGNLDNVFEYSVSQFTEDNNFGRLDLSSWFTDMFLDDNAHNNLYVNFVNWYLNYAMLVSLMHFLFLVLMWFVNYSRRLLERGMNYDW